MQPGAFSALPNHRKVDMLIALWILNGLLALVFIAAGATKLFRPRATLIDSGMGWATDFSEPVVKLIGAVEILGAIGLIVPLLTGIAPVLTPLASVGLAIAMVGAIVVHIRRKEAATSSTVLLILTVASAVLGFLVVA
ncbi:DoxX family protein [Microbacterium koreense]|uniref:DoxX family protein n=1 Tax=Microbacterium koreense TaxID=323761 RepID=A0ABW2ZP74_9MICO